MRLATKRKSNRTVSAQRRQRTRVANLLVLASVTRLISLQRSSPPDRLPNADLKKVRLSSPRYLLKKFAEGPACQSKERNAFRSEPESKKDLECTNGGEQRDSRLRFTRIFTRLVTARFKTSSPLYIASVTLQNNLNSTLAASLFQRTR
jgi:hypothetical protein